jgi:hypothetical protein
MKVQFSIKQQEETTMLKEALEYCTRGWQVFPLVPGQKVPHKDSKGVLTASTDKEKSKAWWTTHPKDNIGIACGERSDLFVVDIDPRHGGDKTFEALQAQHGAVPPTVFVKTGGGGTQIYFRHSAGLRSGAGRLGVGVDHRGDGGYVVAPPSLHPSGDHYTFFDDYSPGQVALAEVPAWIKLLLEKKDNVRPAAIEPEFYRDLFLRGAKDGERNDALVRMAGHLIRKQLDPFMVLEILKLWNEHKFTPPGDPDKLRGIVDRVCAKEYERITKARSKARTQ